MVLVYLSLNYLSLLKLLYVVSNWLTNVKYYYSELADAVLIESNLSYTFVAIPSSFEITLLIVLSSY